MTMTCAETHTCACAHTQTHTTCAQEHASKHTGIGTYDAGWGTWDLRYSATPVIVPPVPTPLTKMSTSPLVSLQISGPVVSRWILAFDSVSN